MKYNPEENNDPYFYCKALFFLILMAIKHWAIGLWVWLFGVSAYIFTFYKFQQTVYLLLPDPAVFWQDYYHPFLAIFYINLAFIFFSVLNLIYDLGTTTDYFLIDWEKEKDIGKFDIGNNKK
eukprot:GHVR01162444.1.p1 GENE.GHVR01162444.1~~GHVR01162444.1.p1  ORF type:complete len:122 (+),score=6.12 GHVR01162444.1:1522-1887(+)